ncbi:hypothetical protein SAMN04488063_1526 [Halopelagius inordinatus]|uniref:DUF7513 domain-containing protein n=1 Tax=Halopelagius inordinatus TaxID=553467 RepID=A0A1I2PHD4_9EURY|nr:hypothetical protein [Halopelagius inordinatus]SFG13407.1 hypothetical protein SAMN04488063_1526 [Halopelagius inordinatus]
MSFFDRLFAESAFRSSKPAFEVGQMVTAFVTGRRGDVALVRVGDTVLELEGAEGVPVETRVRFEVEAFDAESSRGRGRLVDVLEDRG